MLACVRFVGHLYSNGVIDASPVTLALRTLLGGAQEGSLHASVQLASLVDLLSVTGALSLCNPPHAVLVGCQLLEKACKYDKALPPGPKRQRTRCDEADV